jgi:hypothetical protein
MFVSLSTTDENALNVTFMYLLALIDVGVIVVRPILALRHPQ